jgi:hypothetical protein
MDYEYDEKIEYDEGLREGYEHASEQWSNEWDDDQRATREYLTCLVYREPRQLLWERIQDWKSCHGCPDAYLRGFEAGLYKALDERDANEWLSTLPGYHEVLSGQMQDRERE